MPTDSSPPPAGAEIRLDNVWKAYGEGAPVVKGVDLTIAPGEFLTLLGPSGSGKTTTLNMIAGFAVPTRGAIVIEGRNVTTLPPRERGLGMVFQNYALFPHMSVERNVAFPLEVRHRPRAEVREKVRRALGMVQLEPFAERLPRQLSGGQQQRVALARAIVFEPRVLLMDEPLGALDKKLREQMQLEIKRLQRQLGVTVVYVTHDQEEALTMSDRIAVMRDGAIEQVGPPATLYEDPRTTFVADFLGESNLIPGIVREGAGSGMAEIAIDGGLSLRGRLGEAPLAAGSSARASIRPEKLAIGPVDANGPGSGWTGRVEELIYVGDATKLRIALGPLTLIAKRQNASSDWQPAVGAPVAVSWRPEHVKILPQ